jgi:hypothetical protein
MSSRVPQRRASAARLDAGGNRDVSGEQLARVVGQRLPLNAIGAG